MPIIFHFIFRLVFANLDIVLSMLQRDYVVHEGKNFTIKCDDGSNSDYPVLWTRNNEQIEDNYNLIMVRVVSFSVEIVITMSVSHSE